MRKRDPYRRRHKLHVRRGPEAQLHLSPLRRAAGDACAGHTSDYSLPAGAARRARDARILAAIRCMGGSLAPPETRTRIRTANWGIGVYMVVQDSFIHRGTLRNVSVQMLSLFGFKFTL